METGEVSEASFPMTDHHDDVLHSAVSLPGRSGTVPTLVYRPVAPGRHPGIVLAAEAFGINDLARNVAATLAHLGFAVVVPDFYRGNGPTNPESYDDFTEVIGFIQRLDFTQATLDFMAGLDYLLEQEFVDPARVGVWGYCTGGTLAMLTASLRPEVAAAVLFYPSQPVFESVDLTRPVQPIDLLWNVRCPLLFIYGDEDQAVGPEVIAELRHRLELWGIDHSLLIYEGAGHAFCAPIPPLRNEQADHESWREAVAFALSRLAVS